MTRSTSAEQAAAQAWFDHDRFGLFVHFGLYSVAARHEWVMTRERRTVEDYEKYAEFFEPDLFDATRIAELAKSAGMGYAVLTTKHHDGFCLWDSDLTDYTSMRHQGRDFVAEWVEALRAAGLKVGLYHSLLDWYHPDFPYDFHHPRRDDADARDAHPERTMVEYRKYLKGQVRELLTRYGTIDYIFFDFSYPWEVDGWTGKGKDDWGSEELLEMVTELQPGILVNDRLDIPGDFVHTPSEVDRIAADVAALRSLGSGAPVRLGFVVGALRSDPTIDEDAAARLRAAAGNAPLTFHRGFDLVPDQFEGLEALVRLGYDRFLTTGGSPSTADPARLAALVDAAGERIGILASGGLRSANVSDIVEASGAKEVHMRAPGPDGGTSRAEIDRIIAALRDARREE